MYERALGVGWWECEECGEGNKGQRAACWAAKYRCKGKRPDGGTGGRGGGRERGGGGGERGGDGGGANARMHGESVAHGVAANGAGPRTTYAQG